ncbi:hypothetical protein ONE63_001665 [Megalurothrips usitatus]|uniref:Uncharacterized protein n=1 Tax=Megalurothrips usitatus TaxID=439358 RepID=A0AAV7XCQ3_9NEOP|nr:hypothetical protein ONE63_001665 [Megalurothrips usitatus]
MKATLLILAVLAAFALAQAVPAFQDVAPVTIAPPSTKGCVKTALGEVALYFSKVIPNCQQANTNIITTGLCIASSSITGVRAAITLVARCIL